MHNTSTERLFSFITTVVIFRYHSGNRPVWRYPFSYLAESGRETRKIKGATWQIIMKKKSKINPLTTYLNCQKRKSMCSYRVFQKIVLKN